MKGQRQIDWEAIRAKAATFGEPAFAFVQDGLAHTVKSIHGEIARDPGVVRGEAGALRDATPDERFHVSGQQLCMGLRDLAIQRYGLLARTVLNKWNVHRTDDFGTIVYAMIDREELRSSERDSIEDFAGVYDFDEAFATA